jgi:hypothetical protein
MDRCNTTREELGISVFLLFLAHTHITIKIDAIHWGICEACGFNPTLIQFIFGHLMKMKIHNSNVGQIDFLFLK